MNKNIVFATVFVLVLLSYNQASAGFLDWLDKPTENEFVSQTALFVGDLWSFSDNTDDDRKNASVVRQNAVAQKSQVTAPKAKTAGTRAYVVSASAYSSTPDQTDASPFITARGTYVRDGIIAANFLPFGTRVKIPKMYGNKIFIVEDRMNKRYGSGHIDIWFPDRESALQFGRRTITIEVLSS